MKWQTIDGKSLSREEFKRYVYDVFQVAKQNKNFNHYHFIFDLHVKCELTLENFAEILREIKEDMNHGIIDFQRKV
jgi:hypothetical protein